MDLYSKKDKSISQKVVLIVLEIIILWVSYWILFVGGYHQLFSLSIVGNGSNSRHIILFVFNLIVFCRICITIFYLLRRHMPWEEAFSIPFAFAIYYIGFALLGYKTEHPLDFIDVIGLILFAVGSYLNTGSELMRDKWKKVPGNKEKLYTDGLFRYAMHINYFGDILWVTAYAILTRNWYSCLIPAFITCFFAFYNAPKLDKYLASKYGNQFDEYRKRTKKLIPFIY
jgi:protein-S-isoprenylcysteine O-methyltransferase Ste14